MHLTNIEVLKVIGLVIYIYSMIIYLKQINDDLVEDRPKILQEWIAFTLVSVGAFVPILNTIVAVLIIKFKRQS
mgnify:FL=1|tara:strand:- start:442 stop:663 length:222 start_codon:yes stop_codon:yes gene_type:complete